MLPNIPIKPALRDSILAALLALVLFGPIMGAVLDGYTLDNQFGRVFWMVLAVAIGRFTISLLSQTVWGQKIATSFIQGRSVQVTVRQDSHSHHKWLWLLFIFGLVYPLLAHLYPHVLNLPFTDFSLGGKYGLTIIILALIYVLLGMGLNIVVGLAGLLDLGYVAFYAIGAYGLTIGYEYLGLGFWAVLILSPILAASWGAILGFPVLRMHGDYLAIVTLGFGEIIRLVLTNWGSFTGGPNGMSAPHLQIGHLVFRRRVNEDCSGFYGLIDIECQPFHEALGLPYSPDYRYMFLYWLLFFIVVAALYINRRLVRMPVGRAWEALREDQIACRSLGLNHVLVKLSAFMIGASIGGVAGVFFASYQGFVNPSSFTFFESALILAIVVLGGLGSTVGVFTAAIVLTLLPELLREIADYRILAFGMLMVIMMIWRPRGFVKPMRRAYEMPSQERPERV